MTTGRESDPLATRVENDPGDTTQRNFRYQHAYGASLLVSSLRGHLDYQAIWCEHHEDLLGEHEDGTLDAFQVKTRDEQGQWETGDESFAKALATLGRAANVVGTRMRRLVFVSNAGMLKTTSKQERAQRKSPTHLTALIKKTGRVADLPTAFRKVVQEIAERASETAELIFSTLARIEFVKHWARDSIDAELSQHLAFLPELQLTSASRIREAAGRAIARFFAASSLACADPAKYYGPLRQAPLVDPVLAAKRVGLDEIRSFVTDAAGPDFRYPSEASQVPAFVDAVRRSGGSRLRKKLMLARVPTSMIDASAARATATMNHLLELGHQNATEMLARAGQLEQYVLAEYGETETAVIAGGTPLPDAGPRLMEGMNTRLRDLAQRRVTALGGEPYEHLSGVAALLTDECKIWWGPAQALGGTDDD